MSAALPDLSSRNSFPRSFHCRSLKRGEDKVQSDWGHLLKQLWETIYPFVFVTVLAWPRAGVRRKAREHEEQKMRPLVETSLESADAFSEWVQN